MIHPRGQLAIIFVLALSGIGPVAAEWSFERHEVVTVVAERPSVLTGFLGASDVADLVVVYVDEAGERRLRIYGFEGDGWAETLETVLRPGTRFVDVGVIGGRDRLLTYRPGDGGSGTLAWLEPETGAEHALAAVACSFEPPRPNEVPWVDVTRDVTGDGVDDLVIPGSDGFRVLVQTRDGKFADPVRIGPDVDLSGIYGADGYRYDPWSESRIHEVDHDRDGRSDLLSWNGDRFEVHRQDGKGLFAALPETFATEVDFDTDRVRSLARGSMTGRALHSVTDVSSDGVADLVVYSLEGTRIEEKRSAYEVHLGVPTPGGTVFEPDAAFTFESDRGIQVGMARYDLDGDGGTDWMVTTIDRNRLESSLWKRIKGFMGDDVGFALEFYRQRDGLYHDEPDTVRGMGLDGAPSHREPGWVPLDLLLRGGKHEERLRPNRWPRAFNPTRLLGDVTGDGRADLLREATFRGIDVFVGKPGPDPFARQPQHVPGIVPSDEEYNRLVDLDRNGKLDLLMHDPFTERDVHGGRKRPPGTEAHRIRILLSR